MGSDTGQDNERPVRRVWIDGLEFAECQVTNADYARFVAATAHRPPPQWNDPSFSNPKQPVVAVGYEDGLALLVRIDDGAEILARKPGNAAITALAWNAAGTMLAFGCDDGSAGVVPLA